jgi:hypothetical protein
MLAPRNRARKAQRRTQSMDGDIDFDATPHLPVKGRRLFKSGPDILPRYINSARCGFVFPRALMNPARFSSLARRAASDIRPLNSS